jgi:hypothetical protein
MQKTKEILKEIETMLLRAELRIAMVNGELTDLESPMTDDKVTFLIHALESIHHHTTRLENQLLRKLNQTLQVKLSHLENETIPS